MSFLDTWVIHKGRHIYTTLYTKPTDSNSLLYNSSYHSIPLKKGLSYSRLHRARRICTTDENFQIQVEFINFWIHKLYDQFLMSGYPRDVLDQALAKASKQNRNELLTRCKSQKQKKFSCVFNATCSPLGPEICNVVKKTLEHSFCWWHWQRDF